MDKGMKRGGEAIERRLGGDEGLKNDGVVKG